MSDLGSVFTALTWVCSAPLIASVDLGVSPLPPVTLSLTAAPEGAFEALGARYEMGAQSPVTWSGTWIAHDDGLALIGTWDGPDGLGTMQAHSLVVEKNVLMLEMRRETSGLTLRCLEDRGSL